jgi:ABC-type multidrug transport system fused ATPase/permease subunit
MLQSIRVIKLYAWEAPLEKRVNAVRDKETSTLHRYLDSAGQLRELIFSAQPISALIIFVTATYGMKDPLTVAQIFRVIAFLNITRFPLNLLGQAMKNVSDGLVSIERLNRFFLLPTLQNVKHREIAENPHIELVDATFSWQDQAAEKLPVPSDSKAVLSSNTRKSELGQIELVIVNSHGNVTQEVSDPVPLDRSYFQLNEVNFTTNRPNELIAIIGSVGCGKSSFMSALLGEMNKVSGKCNVSGTLSFCSQTPWIQNITLKQNIVFEFDQNSLSPEMNLRYRNSLDAAALLPDIAILPSGDMTESKRSS